MVLLNNHVLPSNYKLVPNNITYSSNFLQDIRYTQVTCYNDIIVPVFQDRLFAGMVGGGGGGGWGERDH